jgi:hypothetical protein
VQVIVLPTEDTKSNPVAVLTRLKDHLEAWDPEEGDSLWLCLDADHWVEPGHRHQLHSVMSESRKQRFDVAISHPCFEFWLLLHFVEPTVDTIPLNCLTCNEQLSQAAGGYNKRTGAGRLPVTLEDVKTAIERAAARWDCPEGWIPEAPSTGVHRIVSDILDKGVVTFV